MCYLRFLAELRPSFLSDCVVVVVTVVAAVAAIIDED